VKHIFEVLSGGRLYVPNFIKTGSGLQKLVWRIYTYIDTDTNKGQGDFISLLSFSRKEIRLKREHFCLIYRLTRLMSVYK
jgi:hypothetical protein